MTEKRIWLVGGGTGGHIMPLLAVAEVLKRDKQVRLTFLGEKHGPEAVLAHGAGITFVPITAGKLRRYFTFTSLWLNVRDVFRIVWGVVRAYNLIGQARPDVIFSKAGPVALPVAIAAWLRGVPLVTHESDSVLGATNRFISRFAKQLLTGFPAGIYPAHYAAKLTSVGIPLRQAFLRVHAHESGRKPMILIMGGSQGAQAINNLIEPILPDLLKLGSVMHVTGERDYDHFCEVRTALPSKLADHYGVINFTSTIAEYMAEATLVVNRAGSSIFELATLHKPMVLIPLPSAANNHQVKNAEYFARYHAAIMLLQDNLTPERLYETIKSLFDHPDRMRELKEGTRIFDSRSAAQTVAELLKSYCQRN